MNEDIKRQLEENDIEYQKQHRRNTKKLQIIDYSQSLPSRVNKFIKFGWANLDILSFWEIVDAFKVKYESKETKKTQQ